ncbi:MAG: hypothetical protein K2L45_10840 [Muribaculaceae bacterium]|nr:hypothetical protein [Muribaculaceae bacterium]
MERKLPCLPQASTLWEGGFPTASRVYATTTPTIAVDENDDNNEGGEN